MQLEGGGGDVLLGPIGEQCVPELLVDPCVEYSTQLVLQCPDKNTDLCLGRICYPGPWCSTRMVAPIQMMTILR